MITIKFIYFASFAYCMISMLFDITSNKYFTKLIEAKVQKMASLYSTDFIRKAFFLFNTIMCMVPVYNTFKAIRDVIMRIRFGIFKREYIEQEINKQS